MKGRTVLWSMIPVPGSLRSETRYWVLLSLSSLALAGGLALLLALSRTPGVQEYLPVHFFRAALVTHVIFSVVIWYLGMAAAVCTYLVAARSSPYFSEERTDLFRFAPSLATGGMVLLLVPFSLGLGEPSLNNYVPVIGHPVFGLGLVLLGIAFSAPFYRVLMWPDGRDSGACLFCARGLAAVWFLALVCCVLAALTMPSGLQSVPFNETLFWGTGHLLQFLNFLMMVLIWQDVGRRLHGEYPLSSGLLRTIVVLVVSVALLGPFLYLFLDPRDARLFSHFTLLYQLGLIGQPFLAVAGLVGALLCRGLKPGTVQGAGLGLSCLLFVIGGLFGYALGGGDTRTPAHYHLVIGGVMLALMVFLATVLLPWLGYSLARMRSVLRCLGLYGAGQLLHAGGLFVAGSSGIARKTAGGSQGLDTPLEIVSMMAMGCGALVAVIGGASFVWIIGSRLLGPPSVLSESLTESGGRYLAKT
ncbi:hypothetical protein HEQ60_08965 [Haematospirillum sp. H1815]|uniref:cbb3-type cytochrome c oxidase subunit I n=1 Tax=Haematospirillum sp. H1815 TaxID=2723108 RepID=UPI001438C9F1|nr:cbb3-type cytochrome c oxidase subunit I [Haematospirillum sp. H1815]NKD77886.1 hypothetical protein [Haematospirillum sp. H1815]